MSHCKANNCCLPVPEGTNFCTNHCIRHESVQCAGTTLRGYRCRQRVICGKYCHSHIYPVIKVETYDQRALYRPDNLEWPHMETEIRYQRYFKTYMFQSGREMDRAIQTIDRNANTTKLSQNTVVIKKIELFFHNYHLNYESEYWQTIITQLHEYLEPHSFIKEYRELFRRKFDLKYRKENQLIYTEKILKKTDIGECAKKIVSFL